MKNWDRRFKMLTAYPQVCSSHAQFFRWHTTLQSLSRAQLMYPLDEGISAQYKRQLCATQPHVALLLQQRLCGCRQWFLTQHRPSCKCWKHRDAQSAKGTDGYLQLKSGINCSPIALHTAQLQPAVAAVPGAVLACYQSQAAQKVQCVD